MLHTKPIPERKIMANEITPQRIPCKNAVNVSQKVFLWASQKKLTWFIKNAESSKNFRI